MQIKIGVDRQKAMALIKMAKTTLERLKETSQDKYPTNALTDYYDILHKVMEALVSVEGIKIKGEGAHQELIDYVCKRYELGEPVRRFLQELRDYRNRVSYEGFMITPAYIKANFKKIEEIINILMGLAGVL
jgi:uncharacterized coiled-coil DUF342 family protein